MRPVFFILTPTLLLATTPARPTNAQGVCDGLVRQHIAEVLATDYGSKNYDSALQKLQNAPMLCGDGTFSRQARADLHMAIGTVYGAMGSRAAAQRSFLAALRDDPDIKASPVYTNKVADEAFKRASINAAANGLTVRFTSKVSGYTDTTGIHVFSPSVAAGVEHAQGAWGAGALLLMDVARASDGKLSDLTYPRPSEERYASAINGHKKFGNLDLALAGSLWGEPQYLSVAVGVNASLDLAQKTIIPKFGYQYSHDLLDIVRLSQSYDGIERHTISAGLGLVLSKATFGTGLLTMVFEEGYQPSPSPFNSLITAAANYPGLIFVHGEHLPVDRQRFGLTFSVAHRLANATLRMSERGYYDSWGMLATTTDGRLIYDVTKSLRLWPHLRMHYQGNASMYRLPNSLQSSGYEVDLTDWTILAGTPAIAQMLSVTIGGGARYGFGKKREYGLVLNADFISTLFFNFSDQRRFAFFGTLAFEAEFE